MRVLRGSALTDAVVIVLLLGAGCAKPTPLQALTQQQQAPVPDTISFRMTGYKPSAGKVFKDLFVSNFSVKAARGKLSLSTSRDGMTDTLKTTLAPEYGFTLTSPQSGNQGFSDLLLYFAGIKLPQQSLLFCPDSQKLSSSNDAIVYTDSGTSGAPTRFLGLRDCEKQYMGLNPAGFDFDEDGIPDYLELRCGLNPKNKNDAQLSAAGDGISSLEKCKRGIPVDESANSQPNRLFAYQYQIEVHADSSRDFTISNIPVLNGGRDNLVVFYLTEGDPNSKQKSLFTAFARLGRGAAGSIIKFPYWATDPSRSFNQEIVTQ